MAVTSAGILLYRLVEGAPQVLIAHMGGPYWASKDAGAWSIPKGEYDADSEAALDAALREFAEELGVPAPAVPYAELGTFPYSSGKRVTVFVADGAGLPLEDLRFGEFDLEWPPRSGRRQSFPEVDRVEWTGWENARERLVKGQRPALDALERQLADAGA
ncbi:MULTISPECIES: NUDIX domain-containing protein [unclassified Microbacterium]|uniref:NUDIX domain-containing protein n=1 Tax=unclassified Microbacterium TaxID=2609290 RepID=UPI00214C63ED|nr:MULTISPECIES: NUDIX domain-containing protein [unclassified Microbacterium]MCR2808668.1 NUDIX domain-containing protein [Microbacterium sp. zg.B185]WIM18900.1 NUDIX domain-containing protein [Microbacterium sp. zg-B185]